MGKKEKLVFLFLLFFFLSTIGRGGRGGRDPPASMTGEQTRMVSILSKMDFKFPGRCACKNMHEEFRHAQRDEEIIRRGYLRINSKQARHFPTASTDLCMDISRADRRHFYNQDINLTNGPHFARRILSSCPSSPVRPLRGPRGTHSFMGFQKEDCHGSVRFFQPPYPEKKKKEKKKSTSASRLLLGGH